MRKANPFISLLGATILIAAFSLLCNYLSIPTQTRVWEFPVDFRIGAIALMAWYAIRVDSGSYLRGLGLGSVNWVSVFSAFIAPAALLLAAIAIGYTIKAVEFQGVENAPTFFLAAVIDLPALFFFSATTILAEEIVFRGVFLKKLSERGNLFSASLLASILWAVLRLTDAVDGSIAEPIVVLSQFMNLLSLGVVLSFLFVNSGSIWVCYAFRLGLATFSLAFLSGADSGANSLFVTESPYVEVRGLTMTLLYCMAAIMLVKYPKYVQNRDRS